MNKIQKSLSLAQANLGRSVIRINPHAEEEAKGKNSTVYPFGIKNTRDIPATLIDKLRNHPSFLWLTIDKMADLGRSIDTDLINPLTYRLMTGSTSGGCVNILKGINKLCLGTDGGGSVLAPALSTNLYSFMGKGCGLATATTSHSTDNLAFSPGLGLIAAQFDIMEQAAKILCETAFETDRQTIRVLVPTPGNITLPGGGDSRTMLDAILSLLPQHSPSSAPAEQEELSGKEFQINEYHFSAPYERETTVKELEAIFQNNLADLVLSYEGPIDIFGYDETIPRTFSGAGVKEVTGLHGKALVKAANICGCSALTIPGPELAAGCVLLCGPGQEKAAMGFALAKELHKLQNRPELFERYFIRREKFVEESPYQ